MKDGDYESDKFEDQSMSSRDSVANIDFGINGDGMTMQEEIDTKSSAGFRRVDKNVSDDEFKRRYDKYIVQEKSTLVLKTSFHLINLVLMGLC